MRSYKIHETIEWRCRPIILEIYDNNEFIDSRRFSADDPDRIKMFADNWIIHGRGIN